MYVCTLFLCRQQVVKSSRSNRRGSHRYDDDDDDDVERDVVDVLTKFCEQRLEIWRGGSSNTAQSQTADSVSYHR